MRDLVLALGLLLATAPASAEDVRFIFDARQAVERLLNAPCEDTSCDISAQAYIRETFATIRSELPDAQTFVSDESFWRPIENVTGGLLFDESAFEGMGLQSAYADEIQVYDCVVQYTVRFEPVMRGGRLRHIDVVANFVSVDCNCDPVVADDMVSFSLRKLARFNLAYDGDRYIALRLEDSSLRCVSRSECQCALEDGPADALPPTGSDALVLNWDSPLWCTFGGGTVTVGGSSVGGGLTPVPPFGGDDADGPTEDGNQSTPLADGGDPPMPPVEGDENEEPFTGGGLTPVPPGDDNNDGNDIDAPDDYQGDEEYDGDSLYGGPDADDGDDTDEPADPDDTDEPQPPEPPVILQFKATTSALAQGAGITGSQVQISLNTGDPDQVAGDPDAEPEDNDYAFGEPSVLTDEDGNATMELPAAEAAALGVTAAMASDVIEFDVTPHTGTVAAFAGEVDPADVLPDALLPFAQPVVLLGGNTFIPLLIPEGAVAGLDGALNSTNAISVEPDLCIEIYPLSDPLFGSRGSWGQPYADQWGIQRIGFTDDEDSAWNRLSPKGDPVVVAVIDSGLDWNHREIDWEMLWRNPGEIAANGIDDDGNGYVDDTIGWDFWDNDRKPWDLDGHGTFVSGLLFATPDNDEGIAGVVRHARLMVLKAMNGFGHSRASAVARAIKYAADNGAQVINLSLGGPGASTVIREAIDYAYARDVVVVVAAGNGATPAAQESVASLENVLTVAAVSHDDKRSIYSNYGLGVDLAAPGDDILSLRARRTDLLKSIPDVEYENESAIVGGDRRYYRASGTSFAAPMVTGVAALLRAQDPSLSAEQVMRMLKQSARDVELVGVDQLTGYGVVDANAALQADRDFYLDAVIEGLSAGMRDGKQVLLVNGATGADRFKGATVSIGQGAEPTEWEVVTKHKKALSGELAAIPATKFAGSTVWVVRLEVQHRNKRVREFRFRLDLG